VAEEAVLIGPVSVVNSLLAGKLSGNFADSGLIYAVIAAIHEAMSEA
jgi:hypothetical protein